MNQIDKNQLYHQILHIIQTTSDNKMAAKEILFMFEDREKQAMYVEADIENEGQKSTKQSSIFRRVC